MKKPAQRLLKRVSDIPSLSLAEFIMRPQSETNRRVFHKISFIAFDNQYLLAQQASTQDEYQYVEKRKGIPGAQRPLFFVSQAEVFESTAAWLVVLQPHCYILLFYLKYNDYLSNAFRLCHGLAHHNQCQGFSTAC